MKFFDVIHERASYRWMYEETPVPREDLQKIMEAGLAAPSGCNLQTTRVIGVDEPELVKKLGGMLNKPHFASAPAAIVVLSKPIEAFNGAFYNVQDYAAAIQNMLLAITALGYASCWVEGYVAGSRQVAEGMKAALNVPDEYSVVAYLPVGVPQGEMRRAPKMSFEERAGFNGFTGGMK